MTRILISFLCIGGAIALFVLYTKPTYESTQGLQKQIEQYDLALEKSAELQRLKQTLLSRYNSFNPADIDKLHKLLPDHVDNVRLVLDLDTLASKHGLSLQNVAVDAVATEPDAPQTVAAIGPAAQDYGSLTTRFATTGTYPQFVSFLTDLEQSLRIVDVVDLTLSSPQASGGEPQYRFDISLRTYWLK